MFSFYRLFLLNYVLSSRYYLSSLFYDRQSTPSTSCQTIELLNFFLRFAAVLMICKRLSSFLSLIFRKNNFHHFTP